MRIVLAVLIVVGSVLRVWAEIRFVPDDYATVQSALDSSLSGDTVLVRPGQYIESLIVPEHDVTLAGQYLLTGDTNDIAACILRAPANPFNARNLAAFFVSSSMELGIVGLTFQGGGIEAGPVGRGGLEIYGRRLVMQRCVLDSAYWPTQGAVVVNSGSATFEDCRIQNSCSSPDGWVLDFGDVRVDMRNTDLSTARSTRYLMRAQRCTVSLRECALHDLGWPVEWGGQFVITRQCDTVTIAGCEISRNRFQHFFADDSMDVVRFDSNYVHNNEVQDNFFIAQADTLPDRTASFYRNIFVDNTAIPGMGGRMFILVGDSVGRSVRISDNLFARNFSREYAAYSAIEVSALTCKISGNYILDDSVQAVANSPGGAVVLIDTDSMSVQHEIFMQNRSYAVFQGLRDYPPGYALHCYFGDSTGPRHSLENPLGQGDSVQFLIHVTPWERDTSFLANIVVPRRAEPIDFLIGRAYPDPFNSSVTIEFVLTRPDRAQLEIFDVLGRRVTTLVDEPLPIGIHHIQWQPIAQGSGIYFARLTAQHSRQTAWMQKLVLLK